VKRLNGAIALAVVLCLSGGSSSAAEIILTANVLRVHPLADGSIVLMMTADSSSCTNTSTPYKHYHVKVGQNNVTTDGLRAIQATAMTAFSTGYRLAVYFDDGTTFCYVNRVLLKE